MEKISNSFNINFIHFKIFGIWPSENNIKYYKYYSLFFLTINLFLYNILLTLNLVYTPREIDLLVREIIFYFTEVAVMAKVFMILRMRKEILQALELLDCKAFKGEDYESQHIIEEHVSTYKICWKVNSVLSHIAITFLVPFAILVYFLIPKTSLDLPVCGYYFLSKELVNKYFVFWYTYQSVGMYCHMQYNINIDSFMTGLIYMAIGQVKVLNLELRNMETKQIIEKKTNPKLLKCIKHHRKLLEYCKSIQDIISVTMFVQFSMASLIICVVLYKLTLPCSIDTYMSMGLYLLEMVFQIFFPAWLGTQLRYESQGLVFAAYSSNWISMVPTNKSTLKIFMQRAKSEIKFCGWKMFPLSLDTFVSIMKTAYSFFTLIRNMKDDQDN